MLSICIFCGSSTGRNSAYKGAAIKLGRLLAERELTLVYGGGNIGLMGEIAQSVINNSGKAIGVIPQFLVEKELVYDKLTEVRVVDSMHEYKDMLLINENPAAMLESLTTFELPAVDKWGNLNDT